MTVLTDLRDLADALDCIAYGALPTWIKPTTESGRYAQERAQAVYRRWVDALHAEGAAVHRERQAAQAEAEQREHSAVMTARTEQAEAARDRLRWAIDGAVVWAPTRPGETPDDARIRGLNDLRTAALRAAQPGDRPGDRNGAK